MKIEIDELNKLLDKFEAETEAAHREIMRLIESCGVKNK